MFLKFLYPILLLLITGGCKKVESPFTINLIPISEDITDTSFWKKSNKYIIEKSDFAVTSELSIQDGTVIIIKDGCSITLKDNGHISAQGSISEPIIFTSQYDPEYGNTPNSKLVAPGNWNNIRIESIEKSVFNMCEFYYGGGGESPSTIELADSTFVTITNCTFKNNKGGNLQQICGVINASKGLPNTSIRNNILALNSLPISINSTMNLDNSNIFYDPKTGGSNKYNVVQLNAQTIVDRRVEWLISNVPICVFGSKLILAKTASVFWGNHSVLKFDKDAEMRIECDTTRLINSDGPGVTFTSYTDDLSISDSNGDGISSLPKAGDWKGITDSTGRFYRWKNIKYSSIETSIIK